MQEFEITTRVVEPLESVEHKLKALGFVWVKNATIDDIYMCPGDLVVTKENISQVLAKSVLIRHIFGVFHGKKNDYKMITYKKKTFKDGVTVAEEKIKVDVDSIEHAKDLLSAIGFKELVKIHNDYIVYKKDDLEVALQSVRDLGLLIECESDKACDNMSTEEILEIKKEMLKEVKNLGIETTDEFDVKKAYELVEKSLKK